MCDVLSFDGTSVIPSSTEQSMFTKFSEAFAMLNFSAIVKLVASWSRLEQTPSAKS